MTASVIPAADLRPFASKTMKFEGADHGSDISFFYVDNEPGQGPGLHRHPYTETWVVVEGEATIRIGDDTIVAHESDTAVVAPMVWHGFTNTGTGRLRIMCIHASPRIIQEFMEGEEP
ncbi:MAG: cupin domain-containing protein [Microbacterium sp.]